MTTYDKRPFFIIHVSKNKADIDVYITWSSRVSEAPCAPTNKKGVGAAMYRRYREKESGENRRITTKIQIHIFIAQIRSVFPNTPTTNLLISIFVVGDALVARVLARSQCLVVARKSA